MVLSYLNNSKKAALVGMLTHMGHANGGCERLASTPIPFTDGVLVHRTKLEDPFGATPNDLALDTICWTCPRKH